MGSGTSQSMDSKTIKLKHIDAADMTQFNQEVNRMKYCKQEKVFRQKSLQTKAALSAALANLHKNKLLDTGEFQELKKVPLRNRLKTDKTEVLRKKGLMQRGSKHEKQWSRKKNKSQYKLYDEEMKQVSQQYHSISLVEK